MFRRVIRTAIYRWALLMSLIIGLGLGFQIAYTFTEIYQILGLGGHF